jgi:hypothetical protein
MNILAQLKKAQLNGVQKLFKPSNLVKKISNLLHLFHFIFLKVFDQGTKSDTQKRDI